MRAVIQRVLSAQVEVEGACVGKINEGLLVYLGVGQGDSEQQVATLADKLIHLRLFPNEKGQMHFSISEHTQELLIISQFTLYANMDKGRRPDFFQAADPEVAQRLYELFIESLKSKGLKVESGHFGAYMKIASVADGPVTLILER